MNSQLEVGILAARFESTHTEAKIQVGGQNSVSGWNSYVITGVVGIHSRKVR
jgi:hypothetical protein